MAVINKKDKIPSLKALTATALSLPGLLSPIAYAAEGDEVDFQYSHYQEGKRDIFIDNADLFATSPKAKSFNPIEVESLHGSAKVSLTDRIKFAFNYVQDTWGGATPVATAPAAFKGNKAATFAADGIVVTGSSPYVTDKLALDAEFNPLDGVFSGEIDPVTQLDIFKYSKNSQLQHIMATASPETRKQGDFKLSYDWDEVSASIGGGVSIENDYESHFGNVGGRFDFNQKQTTLNVDLSYTNSETKAILDHDSLVSVQNAPPGQIDILENLGKAKFLHDNRQDWSTHLGLTQVLSKDALVSADFSYTRSTGYMGNPYKGVAIAFIDPGRQLGAPKNGYNSTVFSLLEQRPEERNQWNVGGRYVQYVEPLDAALHFDYRFAADDWGIQSHTFEADWVQPLGAGWTVTPRIRYYSQDAANFYAPWLVTQQAFSKNVTDQAGNNIVIGSDGKEYSLIFDPNTFQNFLVDAKGNRAPSSVKGVKDKRVFYDPKKLPTNFSSDHRLSGYGTLSGGVTVAKQFVKGLTLETGFEYYTHQGSLKVGGGGEDAYADFDYWLANATLKVDLNTLAFGGGGRGSHFNHQNHNDHGVHAPAGVMFDHMLPKAGDFMVGYRYMWNSQSGNMLHGTDPISDQAIINNGCVETGSLGCFLTPDSMTMSMHMLDLMVAPTDWLTLMLMPQFMDMGMDMRSLDGAPPAPNQHATHHMQNGHETGGIGDLGMYALFKLFDNGIHHLHVTTGISAPTADVNLQLRRNHGIDGGFIDYGMQLGSGTWDFKPSLTYTGHTDDFSWGVQANGIVRMEDHNKSGYRLGDMFQGTAWGAYNLTNWLTVSVRGLYTMQDAIKGQFIGANGQFYNPVLNPDGTQTQSSILKFGPQDYPNNYGGRFWDVGFGLSAVVPSGDLAGNRVSVEWLQPVEDDVNGYQLKRDGALSATWNYSF
ncbi:DUF3570 domain-containing protein [Methyloglobulus sp.]|uniref:DUF3570 domain-containing protein n=1 Tax=Methyloglobulus sp. TaxID=2518622 RepID=UPI0032B71363